MRRYLLHISYFGTRYRGFQKQNVGDPTCDDFETVCGLLEIALKKSEPTNHPIVIPSSRTDKGVHALSNAVHVDLESDNWKFWSNYIHIAANRFFDKHNHDIRILRAQEVPDDFHCRYAAYERRYMYRVAVPKRFVQFRQRLTIPAPITEHNHCHFLQHGTFDVEAIRTAAKIFVGKKDFAGVRSIIRGSSHRSTIREIQSIELLPGAPFIHNPKLLEEYNFWNFIIVGKSFLYHQVRRIVSLLIQHGQGRISLSELQEIMDAPQRKDRKIVCPVLPPHGLYLTDVLYKPEDLKVELTPKERNMRVLYDEEFEINEKLQDFSGSVLEKISLKTRLLEIKKILNSEKFNNEW